jgi:hypothetical protein
MRSVLHKASKADINEWPFPHIVIENALPDALYDKLAREFPASEVLLDGRKLESNKSYHYNANRILSNSSLSETWREFVSHHVSTHFYQDTIALIGDHLRRLHPDIEAQIEKTLKSLSTSVRFAEEFRDVALECQIAYGSPVVKASRFLGPHVDREVALFAGLLYFRLDEDDSTGGDLEFYRFKGGERAYAKERRRVPDHLVERAKVVTYARNKFVFFLNSPESLHGVSMRSETKFPRLHVNFVAELQTKIFDLSRYPTLEYIPET